MMLSLPHHCLTCNHFFEGQFSFDRPKRAIFCPKCGSLKVRVVEIDELIE